MYTSLQENTADPFSPTLLAFALTIAFMVVALIGSGFILGTLTWPSTLNEVMLWLYDMAIGVTIGYIWWLDRSIDQRDKQDPLTYSFFITCAMVPWVVKSNILEIETSALVGLALLVLFFAFQRAIALHHKVRCLCHPQA